MKNLFFIAFLFLSFYASCQQKLELGKKNRIVEIQTEYGSMKVRLYDETPKHRDNFVKLAHQKFFDGTLFHRVINGFMIQGGDPDSRNAEPGQRLGEGGPGYRIPAEIQKGLFHKKGVIAAAREGDNVNPQKKSAGSQFYLAQGKVFTLSELDSVLIMLNKRRKEDVFKEVRKKNVELLSKYQEEGQLENLAKTVENIQVEVDSIFNQTKIAFSKEQIEAYTTVGGIPHLDGNYTVFGEVIEGIEVIDKIAAVAKDKYDRPLFKDISMKVRIIQ